MVVADGEEDVRNVFPQPTVEQMLASTWAMGLFRAPANAADLVQMLEACSHGPSLVVPGLIPLLR